MRGLLPALIVAGAAGWGATPGRAADAPPSGRTDEARLASIEAPGWLERMRLAARQLSYQGTYVVSAAGALVSSRVLHHCEGPDRYELLEALDGEPRRVYRHNDTVQVVWPRSRQVLLEHRPTADLAGRALEGWSRELYQPRLLGVERVAGREAQALELLPTDAWRYGLRLWIDRATGLLLRTAVVGEAGRVLESAGYIDLSIGRTERPAAPVGSAATSAFHVIRPQVSETTLEREGWSLDPPAPGFRPLRVVRRPMSDASDVVQAVYADGVAQLSIFIEPEGAPPRPTADPAAQGATQRVTRRHGNRWVTAAGDVPAATLQGFIEALRPLR